MADVGPTKTNSPNNLNRSKNNNFNGTTGEEEVDFDGLTNPSIHKVSNNELGGFEDIAYGTGNTSKKPQPSNKSTVKLAKARNKSEQAIMSQLINLIGLNKRVSNYKENRLKELSLKQLIEEDSNIIQSLYKEEEKIEVDRFAATTQVIAQTV